MSFLLHFIECNYLPWYNVEKSYGGCTMDQEVVSLLKQILDRLDAIQNDTSYIESNTSNIEKIVKQIKNK